MKRDKSKWIMLTLFGVAAAFFIYKNYEFDYYLKDNYDFTIGKTIGFSGRGGTQRNIDYVYYVAGIEYQGSTGRDYQLSKPLKRYFSVKYSQIKPQISEISFDNEVTDTIMILNAGFQFKDAEP